LTRTFSVEGLKLTDRTFIELLEYVLLKADFPGVIVVPVVALTGGALLPLRAGRVGRPSEEPEERVSKESSSPPTAGTGSIGSAGASTPFLVVATEALREPDAAKRFFAFGADDTRRMKRVSDAPMPALDDERMLICRVGFGAGLVGEIDC
jgi:hypothetical protein